jgi:peptidyl-prolyl cis-trans isomerase A (cyclophilin A)
MKHISNSQALIDDGFYQNCRFFRVLPNFMVQFGVSGDPNVQKKHKKAIKDDPVLESNKRGTMTFATSGPNTRTTQLFINTNTEDNAFLDEQGFAPFAQVLSGMEFVDQIFDGYREKPDQGLIQQEGNAYLEKEFPKLSWINAVKEIQ